MEFLYFLVTGSDAWSLYHQNFFVAQGGFTTGVIAAAVIGAVLSWAFYFGCCNSKDTQKSANIGVWAAFLLIAIVVGYLFADNVVIGSSSTTDKSSLFRKYSFYEANDTYYLNETKGASPTKIEDLASLNATIKANLDKGGDVRKPYNVTTAVLTAIFFFITSMMVKRYTISGKGIPFKKP